MNNISKKDNQNSNESTVKKDYEIIEENFKTRFFILLVRISFIFLISAICTAPFFFIYGIVAEFEPNFTKVFNFFGLKIYAYGILFFSFIFIYIIFLTSDKVKENDNEDI
jgi:hypothetical protein